jgi:hypothetical protein
VTTYHVIFDRIGRNHSPKPADFEAVDAQDLAEKIYTHVKPQLASRFPDVAVDFEEMTGSIVTGMLVAGKFTITEVKPESN